MTCNSIGFVLGRLALDDARGLDLFPALARLGILSRLACWAEEHCEEPAEVGRAVSMLPAGHGVAWKVFILFTVSQFCRIWRSC